ncbi:bifunctional aminoglycoside phosphotransferase/ATP-binding protein [Thiolapillus sp.]
MDQMEETSSLLISRLMRPALFDHPVKSLRLVETHISWVLLTGDYAYKIKKPVNLGFLDFSTLEKRRFYCEEEVRLNRRLAADYYLDVVPVTGAVERPHWGGTGEVMEYAVKMRQFPQEAQLDRMLDQGWLEPGYMNAFARLIADFHDKVSVAGPSGNYGSPEHVYHPVAGNFTQLETLCTTAGLSSQLKKLQRWSRESFAAMKPVFAQRKAQGFVRECHGDMHLRNMAWIDGQPLVFDCIEFNPDLRWIDVVNEIAFLVMDLLQRRQPELAWRFLNAYLEIGGDYAGMRLLSFYLTYRAMVRAKVAAIRASQAGIEAKDKIVAGQELETYLQLAEQCSRKRRPMLLITRGLSASGKSTLTGALLEKLGAIRIRSDVERKRLFGLARNDRAQSSFGKGIYSSSASDQTYARLLQLADMLLEAGFPVIVDAAFLQPEQRKPFQALAAARRLPYAILELRASKNTLRQRIRRRPKGVSDADLEVLEQQFRSWKALEPQEQGHSICIDMEKEPVIEQILQEIWGQV